MAYMVWDGAGAVIISPFLNVCCSVDLLTEIIAVPKKHSVCVMYLVSGSAEIMMISVPRRIYFLL